MKDSQNNILLLWHETVQFLEKKVLLGEIEVSDIPEPLRISSGNSIYLYGLRAARNISKQKEQSILELILQDAARTHDVSEHERLKYLYKQMAGFYLPYDEVHKNAKEKGLDL